MIYGLSSKFQDHFLVNNDLSANLSDGFLDSSAFLIILLLPDTLIL